MTTTTRINDVDLAAVGSLVQAIQADPSVAATKWRSEVKWQKAFQVEAISRDLPSQEFDEPPTLGGDNTAANPVEQVLSALGACLAIGYAANASAAGITIKDLRIELEGDLDLHTFLGLTAGNAGFSDIRARVHLESDADAKTVEDLHRKVVATSPVGHTITRPVAITVDLA